VAVFVITGSIELWRVVDTNTVLEWLIVAMLFVGGLVIYLVRRGLGKAVETAAEEGVKEAIKRVNWPDELARTLEQTRGTQRQELRFESYGCLWAKMRPLAIYDDTPIHPSKMHLLSRDLSDWYFSETGGLMLTTQARGLYFALQGLLRRIGTTDGWVGERPTAEDIDEIFESYGWEKPHQDALDHKEVFEAFLQHKGCNGAKAMLTYLDRVTTEEWPGEELPIERWTSDVESIGDDWTGLGSSLQYVVVQQVSSVLRTGLVNDVESRLR
jgi:hypothetical protein